jgi:hypothetical protein
MDVLGELTMHTKTITQNIDWLNAIDGHTVKEAIEYLSTLSETLSPDHVLNYTLEGDTHGCSVESCVTYEQPMTNKEILAMLEKRYIGELTRYGIAKESYTKQGQDARAKQCEAQMIKMQKLLDEARAKYGS